MGDKRAWYKRGMRVRGQLGRDDLARAIPAEELERTLGSGQTFCSWDASHSALPALISRWPFLRARPLMGKTKKPKQ